MTCLMGEAAGKGRTRATPPTVTLWRARHRWPICDSQRWGRSQVTRGSKILGQVTSTLASWKTLRETVGPANLCELGDQMKLSTPPSWPGIGLSIAVAVAVAVAVPATAFSPTAYSGCVLAPDPPSCLLKVALASNPANSLDLLQTIVTTGTENEIEAHRELLVEQFSDAVTSADRYLSALGFTGLPNAARDASRSSKSST